MAEERSISICRLSDGTECTLSLEHESESVYDSELRTLDDKYFKGSGLSRIELKDYMLRNGFTRNGNEFTKEGWLGLPYGHPLYKVCVRLDSLFQVVTVYVENGDGEITTGGKDAAEIL